MAAESLFAMKKLMRKEIAKRLENLSRSEIERQGQYIQNVILGHPIFQMSKRVGVYISFGAEVPTQKIIDTLLEPTSGKECFVPKIYPKTGEMKMMPILNRMDFENFEKNQWNILEPPEDGRRDALETGGLDLILCPGLAFDLENRRLGRGKGYYDRYLAKLESSQNVSVIKIGLAFNVQMVPQVPTSDSDILLDEVIFDQNIDE